MVKGDPTLEAAWKSSTNGMEKAWSGATNAMASAYEEVRSLYRCCAVLISVDNVGYRLCTSDRSLIQPLQASLKSYFCDNNNRTTGPKEHG